MVINAKNTILNTSSYSVNRKTFFDYPVPLSGEDVSIDKALDEIDAWCLENEIIPSFFSVPKEGYAKLFARYKYYKKG